jgi:heptosyltransferase-2
MTILVFCPNLVGDTVMATPAFRAIAGGFPGARLVAVVKPGVAATLDGAPWFAERVLFDPRSQDPARRAPAVIRRLQFERADLAVLFPNSFRSAWLAWRAGARRRVGYARGGRGFLLTDRLAPLVDARGRFVPSPIVDAYLGIVRHLRCPVEGPRLELFTTPEEEAAADRAWGRLGLGLGRKVVCLNTGGAYGPAKSWPVEHFAELARRLADEREVDVLVVCGPAEREAAAAIARGAGRKSVVSLADEPLSIGLTKACVRRCSVLVTTDSGPRHFAAAFDVPVVTLFGPTHVEWTLTRFPRAVHLRHDVPCGPCQKRSCPQGHHRCLRDLAPNAVFREVSAVLEGRVEEFERISVI